MINIKYDDVAHYFESGKNEYIFRGGVAAINKLQLWEFMATYEPERGFMLSDDENVNRVAIETDEDGHSGASFGIMMRKLQFLAKEIKRLKDIPRCITI